MHKYHINTTFSLKKANKNQRNAPGNEVIHEIEEMERFESKNIEKLTEEFDGC